MQPPEETVPSGVNETLDRCAQRVYEKIVASVRPSAPPGFPEIPWASLPALLKQYWRDAVAAGLAEASKGDA